jgi:4-methyl-5(b-hydroxyethyl)-thiazole monophosphate biosynthesis
MKKIIYEFLADGFEEIESLAPVDILRRGGLEIRTVSINGRHQVQSSHGVTVVADMLFDDVDFSDAALLMLPGGMPGSLNLNNNEGVKRALMTQFNAGKPVAAICAAPMVLGGLGILKGKRATCSPGFEKYLEGAEYTSELCTVDGNVITGKGPAATLPYAYKLLEMFTDTETMRTIAHKMQYLQLIGEE